MPIKYNYIGRFTVWPCLVPAVNITQSPSMFARRKFQWVDGSTRNFPQVTGVWVQCKTITGTKTKWQPAVPLSSCRIPSYNIINQSAVLNLPSEPTYTNQRSFLTYNTGQLASNVVALNISLDLLSIYLLESFWFILFRQTRCTSDCVLKLAFENLSFFRNDKKNTF